MGKCLMELFEQGIRFELQLTRYRGDVCVDRSQMPSRHGMDDS